MQRVAFSPMAFIGECLRKILVLSTISLALCKCTDLLSIKVRNWRKVDKGLTQRQHAHCDLDETGEEAQNNRIRRIAVDGRRANRGAVAVISDMVADWPSVTSLADPNTMYIRLPINDE